MCPANHAPLVISVVVEPLPSPTAEPPRGRGPRGGGPPPRPPGGAVAYRQRDCGPGAGGRGPLLGAGLCFEIGGAHEEGLVQSVQLIFIGGCGGCAAGGMSNFPCIARRAVFFFTLKTCQKWVLFLEQISPKSRSKHVLH